MSGFVQILQNLPETEGTYLELHSGSHVIVKLCFKCFDLRTGMFYSQIAQFGFSMDSSLISRFTRIALF